MFRPEDGLVSACSNKSFPGKANTRRKRFRPRSIIQQPFLEEPKLDLFYLFGSSSQLRFYVAKKQLGDIDGARESLYFLLAESSNLSILSTSPPHYRPFKVTGGKELRESAKFEKLLEVHNLEYDLVLRDKANNKRFCDRHITYPTYPRSTSPDVFGN